MDEIFRNEIITELKNLIDRVESLEEDKDIYCEFMKTMILNTYSTN